MPSLARPHRPLLVLLALATLAAAACGKVTHEKIDEWRNTEQGPKKMEAALKDQGLDPDLRAHAAEALISLGEIDKVKPVIGTMAADQKSKVFDKLVPRLWDVAKFSDPDAAPTGKQVRAKDAMFVLRSFADDAQREQLDAYLLDWLTAGGFYEQRASMGDFSGERIVRTIGIKAGPKMVQMGQDLLRQQKEQEAKGILVIGKNTLRGIAYTGAPEAIGFLIEVAENTHPQENLQMEAMLALNYVYVEDTEEPKVDVLGLVKHAPRLTKIALDEGQPGENINISYELLVRIPAPECLPPLVALATQRNLNLMLRAIDFSMRCGGAEAIVPVAEAMPIDLGYERIIIEKYIVKKIPEEAKPQAVEAARALLASKSWVARYVGIEILAALGDKSDAAKLRALSGDKTKIKGYWPEPDEGQKPKPEPTLGQRAVEVAGILEKKA